MKSILSLVALFISFSAFAADVRITNSAGFSTYTYDPDTTEVSNCNGGCARAWPPVAVTDAASVKAPFSVVTRSDGSHQLAYQGHPLYTYIGDHSTTDENGDGLDGIWHLAVEAE